MLPPPISSPRALAGAGPRKGRGRAAALGGKDPRVPCAEYFNAAKWKIDFQPLLCGRGGEGWPPRLRGAAKLRAEPNCGVNSGPARAAAARPRIPPSWGKTPKIASYSGFLFFFFYSQRRIGPVGSAAFCPGGWGKSCLWSGGGAEGSGVCAGGGEEGFTSHPRSIPPARPAGAPRAAELQTAAARGF